MGSFVGEDGTHVADDTVAVLLFDFDGRSLGEFVPRRKVG